MPCMITYDGTTAVTFQFSRIGNDTKTDKLLIELDQDPDIGPFIDVFFVKLDLNSELEDDRWFVVGHKRLFNSLIFNGRPTNIRVVILKSRYRRFCSVRSCRGWGLLTLAT